MAKGKKGSTAVVEPEEDEIVLDDEVEEESTEEEGEETPSAKKNGKKGGQDEVTFGVADLCKLAKKKTGKEYSTRDMRALIRKLARQDNPVVKREITPGNRSRYDWSGPEDKEVKAILKAVEAGGIEANKKEALDNLKQKKAAEKAEKGEGKKGKKGKKNKDADED